MSAFKHDHEQHDHEHDHAIRADHANDNGVGAGAPTLKGTALGSTSLAQLSTVLNSVDTTTAAGRTGLPMIQFQSREGGIWTIGQRRIEIDPNSRWAINPTSYKWGYICFSNDNKVIGERLVPVSQPKPDVTELPDKGFPWTEQWAVNMKCIDGTDAGAEGVYKPTTVGGIQAIAGSIDAVRDRLNGGQHEGKIVPICRLEKDSYQHGQYGRVWTPQADIVAAGREGRIAGALNLVDGTELSRLR
jgi:hypothetical protein